MRILASVLVLLATVACKGGGGDKKEPTIDLSTPADVGRSLCGVIEAGRDDLLEQLAKDDFWESQVLVCELQAQLALCGESTFSMSPRGGCKKGLSPEMISFCSIEKRREEWKKFMSATAKAKTQCSVERPSSGSLEQVDIVTYRGKRDTLHLAQEGDKWMATGVSLALEKAFREFRRDTTSGFAPK